MIQMKINNHQVLIKQAMDATRSINNMEDKIAKEWYGCTYDELDYDDREGVTYEAYDRLGRRCDK